MQKEVEHVARTALAKIGDPLGSLDQEDLEMAILNLFLPPFLELVLTKTNFNVPSTNHMSMSDMLALVVVKCAESFYKRTGACILSTEALGILYSKTFKVITAKTYRDFMQRVRVIEGQADHDWSWSHQSAHLKQIQAFEDLFSDLFRCFHLPVTSILSLDDDKLRKLSALFSILGLKRVYTRESGACPVMHMVVSLITGLILAHRLDRPCPYIL